MHPAAHRSSGAAEMAGLGTPNKKFEEEMRAHRRAWKPGTVEYRTRKDYPGARARDHVCNDPGCLNYRWTAVLETYWLCEGCCAICPDTVTDFHTHAPYKLNPPQKKRRAGCAAAFAAWAKTRTRVEKPDP